MGQDNVESKESMGRVLRLKYCLVMTRSCGYKDGDGGMCMATSVMAL